MKGKRILSSILIGLLGPLGAGTGIASAHAAAPSASTPSKTETVSFYSKALKKTMKMDVYLPPGYRKGQYYPTLYMMHGLTGNQGYWFQVNKLNKTADKLIAEHKIKSLIIVTPDMQNSFGLNTDTKVSTFPDRADPTLKWNEGPYETYFLTDIVPYVDAHFYTNPSRTSRYIGGDSMGGFIALHMAFAHPTLFSKVSGDSPAISEQGGTQHFPFADYSTQNQWDPVSLAATKNLKSVKVYLDCGLQDEYGFYTPVEDLYKTLKSRRVNVQMHLSPGDHSGSYWRAHQAQYLEFFAQ